MNNSPCKGCERRTARPNCHATCEEYKDFVNERHHYNEERRKQSVIAEYIKSRHERLDKKDNRR